MTGAPLHSCGNVLDVGLQRREGGEDGVDYGFFAGEEGVRAAGVQVAEGRLVEGGGVHDAARGEMVDDEFDEADLRRGEAAIGEELREGRLRRRAVHADQAAHEMGERGRFAARQQVGEQGRAIVFADFGQGALQRLQVLGGERLVAAQAVDDHLVQVILQVGLDLLFVLRARHPGDVDHLFVTNRQHFVLEVGIDDSALPPVQQGDEIAQAQPDLFQRGRGHAFPEGVFLHGAEEGKLRGNGGDGAALRLQQHGDLHHLLTMTFIGGGVPLGQGQLHAQEAQIEVTRFHLVRFDFAGETGHVAVQGCAVGRAQGGPGGASLVAFHGGEVHAHEEVGAVHGGDFAVQVVGERGAQRRLRVQGGVVLQVAEQGDGNGDVGRLLFLGKVVDEALGIFGVVVDDAGKVAGMVRVVVVEARFDELGVVVVARKDNGLGQAVAAIHRVAVLHEVLQDFVDGVLVEEPAIDGGVDAFGQRARLHLVATHCFRLAVGYVHCGAGE